MTDVFSEWEYRLWARIRNVGRYYAGPPSATPPFPPANAIGPRGIVFC